MGPEPGPGPGAQAPSIKHGPGPRAPAPGPSRGPRARGPTLATKRSPQDPNIYLLEWGPGANLNLLKWLWPLVLVPGPRAKTLAPGLQPLASARGKAPGCPWAAYVCVFICFVLLLDSDADSKNTHPLTPKSRHVGARMYGCAPDAKRMPVRQAGSDAQTACATIGIVYS